MGDGIAHIAPTLPACPGRYYQGTALHHVASRASPPAPSPLPAVPTHHGPQVAALFSRVQREQGRLDVLVNAAWGGNELPRLQADWGHAQLGGGGCGVLGLYVCGGGCGRRW